MTSRSTPDASLEVAYLGRLLLAPDQVRRFTAPTLSPAAAILADLILDCAGYVETGIPLLTLAMCFLPVCEENVAALHLAKRIDAVTAELRGTGPLAVVADALGARERRRQPGDHHQARPSRRLKGKRTLSLEGAELLDRAEGAA